MEDILHRGGVLLHLGLILLIGYIFGNLANLFKLPRVSGYILAGIVMSPSVLGIIDRNFLENADVVTHASLSIITFLIGSSLSWKRVRRLGRSIAFITLGEAELAFIFVAFSMGLYLYLLGGYDPTMAVALALIFGSLASPTDPTATLAVIHEYRSKGILTTSVLGVSALDDATGIMNFVLGFSVALALVSGVSVDLGSVLGSVAFQVLGAVALGVLMGGVMFFLGKFAKARKEAVTLSVGVLFFTFAVARLLDVDDLLSTMSVGVTIANLGEAWKEFEKPLENYIEDLIFTAFFVVGSAFLDLKVLISFLPLVILYVVSRFAGKFVGVYLGGSLSDAPQVVKKYLAFALFPQGGIVIGLALLVYQNPNFKEVGSILVNVVIGATVIHELLGSVFSKLTLTKAGEIPGK
ncbi:cation:proton antiporter [Hydrogenivirga sp. 128-5-R1-1]|uniref:cation:proton antiporter n=1 Tax=Hydrogenivirga sp. 128-5-R1-1 TaxID=392423 RepID=UPI00015F0C78|nr:cation:proton antiporter [Hydrogenivirga sp. 128-5-R1-1]EDP75798.1 Na+/H+ antiporter protein-like protein [Hydrogenivirga sp. 128-5-R1-1]